ncbi:Protein-glutamine gamma-glutamyltransferase [Novipirellula aureliae]|uniref:Protein-glutamine gamma-glutamyltransferase n=1 Tax=Novipirellula aureliae TaxID=2527966 RepID=A0A5C6E6Y4_9BACT|nr:DUF3488 and transglutaminase-like domain-containing protein [Novipirellula aureliae]TWU42959.1 Protein-glutamine gamma-glutamyltransferase [Novipirellula aureliae]
MSNRFPTDRSKPKVQSSMGQQIESFRHGLQTRLAKLVDRKPQMAREPKSIEAKPKLDESKRSEELLVDKRVRLIFALLSLLGGLVLAGDGETHSFALIAIFFAVFGYLFVDWLEFFSLPPMLAYLAMIGSAFYCVSDFLYFNPDSRFGISLSLQHTASSHLVAVSQLLVLVQAILMLQSKTRRVCEQLCVFCLLELVVAAVFNNTISFGILLIPIGIFSAWGLTILSAAKAIETEEAPITIQMARMSVLLMLIPATLLIGGTFFYAIPRTTDAAQMDSRGNAIVGFSDVVRLEQFGQMLQSNDAALHIWLTNRITGEPYTANGGIYLRGRVLETYRSRVDIERPKSEWSSILAGPVNGSHRFPAEFNSARQSDYLFYDVVDAKVDCEASQSAALFAIAPYFEVEQGQPIFHQLDRWTLLRWHDDQNGFPPLKYVFGTNAFHQGYQTRFVARFAEDERLKLVYHPLDLEAYAEDFPLSEEEYFQLEQLHKRKQDEIIENYVQDLLVFDAKSMPTIKRIADSIVANIPEADRNPYSIAQQLESFFSSANRFQYSLNLNSTPQSGVDPIEQFVATDRTGHCQYYASALAMMLRSQGIPARLVVGYYTNDYNEMGSYYLARQSHAHAWVEALIDKQDIESVVYGQPISDQYWYRLDPTPGSSDISVAKTSAGDVFEFAKTLWKGYVVDVSPEKKASQGMESGEASISQIAESRNNLAWWFETTMANIRAGDLGGGAFANKQRFSWPAAILGVGMTLAVAVIGRFAITPRARRKKQNAALASRSRVKFYADATDCLAKVGIERGPAQTPGEFAEMAAARLRSFHPSAHRRDGSDDMQPIEGSLELLTDAFQQIRYGGGARDGLCDDSNQISLALKTLRNHVRKIGRRRTME